MTYFCAQAVFKVPFSNRFPAQKMIEFQIVVILGIPEGVYFNFFG